MQQNTINFKMSSNCARVCVMLPGRPKGSSNEIIGSTNFYSIQSNTDTHTNTLENIHHGERFFDSLEATQRKKTVAQIIVLLHVIRAPIYCLLLLRRWRIDAQTAMVKLYAKVRALNVHPTPSSATRISITLWQTLARDRARRGHQ